jgi:hypothetical protein
MGIKLSEKAIPVCLGHIDRVFGNISVPVFNMPVCIHAGFSVPVLVHLKILQSDNFIHNVVEVMKAEKSEIAKRMSLKLAGRADNFRPIGIGIRATFSRLVVCDNLT